MCFTFIKRKAFNTTTNELADIPIAANHGAIKPSAANGKAVKLYKTAQPRFCFTTAIVLRA